MGSTTFTSNELLVKSSDVCDAHPLVAKLEQFTRLSLADREALRQITARRREVAIGEDIAREGDDLGSVQIILSGWACRYKLLSDGRRQIVGIFLPGDLCGTHVRALLEMDHSIGALTSVTLAEVDADRLADIAARHPRIGKALWWDILASASIQREWTVNLGQRDAPERLGHLFCELHERLRSLGLTQGENCDMPLRQADLAEAMGLTNVHINRSLQALRGQGLIVLKRRRLTILDLDGLRRMSLFDPAYLHLGRLGAHLDANDSTPQTNAGYTPPQSLIL